MEKVEENLLFYFQYLGLFGLSLPAHLCHTGICSFGGCTATGAQVVTVMVVLGKESNHGNQTGYRLVSDLFLNV